MWSDNVQEEYYQAQLQPQVFHSCLTLVQLCQGFPSLTFTRLCISHRYTISSSFLLPPNGYSSSCILRKWAEQSLQGQNCPKSRRKVFHFLLSSGVISSGKLPVIIWSMVQPILPSSCLVILCSPSSMSPVVFFFYSVSASSFQKGSIYLLITCSRQKMPSFTNPMVEKMQKRESPDTRTAAMAMIWMVVCFFRKLASRGGWRWSSSSQWVQVCCTRCAMAYAYLI